MVRYANATTVELRALASAGGKFFVFDRIIDDSVFDLAFNFDRDRNSKLRNATSKVSSAVDRVDNPLNVGVF